MEKELFFCYWEYFPDVMKFFLENLISIFQLMLGGIGIYLLNRRANAADELVKSTNRISYEKTFLDAIKLFESDNKDLRMGAFDSLQRILEEYPEYKKQILQVLFRFIRNNSNFERDKDEPFFVREDIKQIFSIIKLFPITLSNNYYLDGSYLAGAKLMDMTLNCIRFHKVMMNNANLRRSNFNYCNFLKSDLSHIDFIQTKIFGVQFTESDLSFSLFNKNDLTETLFHQCVLIGTKFSNIDSKNFPIKNFESCIIIHEEKLLANNWKFLESKGQELSKFDIIKNKFIENILNFDPEMMSEEDFNTKFPDYIEVIPDLKNPPHFKLEWKNIKKRD